MNRTPTSGNGKFDPDADTAVHDATEQLPPPWERAGADTKHRHDGGRAETHSFGDDPIHRHDDNGRIYWPVKAPADDRPQDGWFELSRADQPTADPAPAVVSDASAGPHPRDGDDAGPGRPPRDEKGRFLALNPRPVEVAAFEQAVIEADDITYRFERNTALLGTMLEAQLEVLNGEVAQLDAAVQAVHDSAPWYTPERVS